MRVSAPQAVVDALLESYDAWSRHDFDTLRTLYTPDTVWDMSNFEGWPETPVYEGLDGLARVMEDWWSAWSDFAAEPLEVILGEAIFVLGRFEARGHSGAEASFELGQVIETRDGLIARVRNYSDVAVARAEAGVGS